MRYSILDPTGNITALVESPVAIGEQPALASDIMRLHPQVEQVGFVRFACDGGDGGGDRRVGAKSHAAGDVGPQVAGELRMAGGEFCGNATMSAAALCVLRRDGLGVGPEETDGGRAVADEPERLLLRVSGAERPVEVRLKRQAPMAFSAAIRMPQARELVERELAFGQVSAAVPIVVMEGISHIVIQPQSSFFSLREDPDAAEQAVRTWCDRLGFEGLGLMFLEGDGPERTMTPLVYVPASGTVFWENSCASGSSAVGMYLAGTTGAPVSLSLREPGGKLLVESDAARRETWLHGSVRLVECVQTDR